VSETLYIEVGKKYLRIPAKGDFLKIRSQESQQAFYGVCMSVNTAHRVKNKRLPIVEVLVDGMILFVPLGIIEVQ
jgi:hypothetical protein|tara:strand:- start:396 stop:620 length:225 start_codon:yes stop_codon:yes gene_type:complete